MNVEGDGKKIGVDQVFQEINKLISLNDDDTKKNNVILGQVLNDVIDALKTTDYFFRDHYERIMFVGSFYKGTKVGKPEEFDLDLIIQLPIKYDSVEFERDLPGYTKLKVNRDCYLPKWHNHSKLLSKWVTDEGYLNQAEFYQWMESLFTNSSSVLATKEYKLKIKKSGPAFTLTVEYPGSAEMSVDLVPVLEFKKPPPVPGEFKEASWLAVPKPLRKEQEKPHLYWRMSFYHYEKKILKRNGYLKPVIRQVKKLRDRYDWKIIASYHIETLFLHEQRAIEATDSRKFDSAELFLHMLKRLKEACEKNTIINYWDESDNLIENLKPTQLASIIGLLAKIIRNIEKDPLTIVDYILTPDELSSIASPLDAIRNSRDSGKCTEAPSTKGNGENEGKQKLQSNSSKLNSNNDSVAVSNVGNVLMTIVKEEKKEIPLPVIAKAETPKASIGSNEDKNSQRLSEMFDVLKSMQSDMADTKELVNFLLRRVIIVEEKLDSLISRSDRTTEDHLVFGTRSIGSLPLNSRIIGLQNNTLQ